MSLTMPPHALEIADVILAALATGAILWAGRRYPARAAAIAARFQLSTRTYILAAMLLPVAVRLAILPWDPVPQPYVHDEFTHLLVGDTLASGRLANPPHPLWRHLETIYILQQPAYAAKYPLGQGIVLAIGQLATGWPWAGVLLSVALMGGAIAWMLAGCLPREWAGIGGLLAAIVYGLTPPWIDGYSGGAFCAFGGALLFGALCRLWREPSRAMAATAGMGWSIVWLIRPYESMVPLAALWGVLAVCVYRDRAAWKRWIPPMLLLLATLGAAGGLTLAHNRAVTGSYTMLPYQYCQRVYGVPQSMLWQKTAPEPPLRYKELREMYTMQRDTKLYESGRKAHWLLDILVQTASAFATRWFALPILILIFVWRDRMVFLAGVLPACTMLLAALYPFFFPHYFAAYACVFTFLIVRGLMILWNWRPGSRALAIFLISGGALAGMHIVPASVISAITGHPFTTGRRAQLIDRLRHVGGQHVVFVRYGADHTFHEEWVYNAANIDRSPIVWVRATDPADEAEVLRYYAGRQFWLATVDMETVRLEPYPGSGR